MLKPVVESLDQVHEDARQHYTADGDHQFVLALDGDPSGYVKRDTHVEQVNKVAEFRDSNTQLKGELEAAQERAQKFGDLDPEAARAALVQVAELRKKGVRKASDVDDAVAQALHSFKSTELDPLRQLLIDEKTARQSADQKVSDASMRNAVLTQFRAAGGQDAAVDFVVGRARDAFVMNGDALTAKPGVYSKDNPGDPLTLGEWMTTQTREIGFAFGASNGGGAHTQDGSPTTALPPGAQYLRNPTPMQLGEFGKEIAEGKYIIVNE
jgi:DNA-directed RNA polymerase subunit F